jgi:diguanylate cyclase (GGDEF)-like protein
LLVAGVALFVLGDLVYGYATLHSGYQSGDLVDTAWMVALALMAIAGTTQRATDRAEPIERSRERVGWLPPTAVAFGFGMLLFSLRHQAVFPGLVMVVIAIVLAGLVLARQVLVQRDLFRAQAELRFQAFHDPLTGLPNRVLVLERAGQLLASARRHERTVPAFFLDIDGFKGVNDTLGHAAGDKLLQTVAGRLTSVVRECDIVGRIGGDEFVILLDPATLEVAPEVVAERMLTAVRRPIDLSERSGEPFAITASIGVSLGPHSSPAELLRAADVALYRAKAGGRNRYVQLEPTREIVAESTRTMTGVGGSHRQEFSESYFRAIVDQTSELLLVADRDGRVRSANAAFERVLGY